MSKRLPQNARASQEIISSNIDKENPLYMDTEEEMRGRKLNIDQLPIEVLLVSKGWPFKLEQL